MNKVVGVFETREEALDAAKSLHYAGFAPETVTIYNREDLVTNHIHVKMSHRFEVAELSVGVVIGSAVGILSGLGVFYIPGFRFIFNAGAVRGLLGGFFLGLIVSGVITMATSIIIYLQTVLRYERHLNEGKFMVFYEGHRKEDIKRAHEILHTPDLRLEFSTH